MSTILPDSCAVRVLQWYLSTALFLSVKTSGGRGRQAYRQLRCISAPVGAVRSASLFFVLWRFAGVIYSSGQPCVYVSGLELSSPRCRVVRRGHVRQRRGARLGAPPQPDARVDGGGSSQEAELVELRSHNSREWKFEFWEHKWMGSDRVPWLRWWSRVSDWQGREGRP